jgi:CheY-like chemotaxis protein
MVREPSRKASRPLRILVVDDNKDAAESTAFLLRVWGYEVEVAADGPSAVLKAQARLPEVVLLDIALPGMNGYEVARRLRNLPASLHLWIIAISGVAAAGAPAADINLHFLKPMDPTRLMTLLEGIAAS